jgi:MFS family permease
MSSSLRTRIVSLVTSLPRTYWLLWVGTLVNRLGGFVVPFLALYLTSQRGLEASQAALMVSLFGAGSFAAALVGGTLSDRWGRRPIMLVSFLVSPLNLLALGLARSLGPIAALTFLQGFLTDLYRPAVNAAVADLVASEDRPRAYGYLYWAINLGFALAPIVAGLLARWAYFTLFVGDAATTAIFGLFVLWGFQETRPNLAHAKGGPDSGYRLGRLTSEPLMLSFVLLALLFGMIYSQANVTLPLDMQSNGLGPEMYGLGISLNGILIVLVGLQAGHVVSRWPRFGGLALAALLLGAGFGLTAFSDTLPLYALSIAIWTFGEIIGATLAPAVVADLSPVDLRGLFQGVYSAAWGLAFFIGPLLGGWTFQHLGPKALWGGCFGAGLLTALGYLLLSRSAERHLARRASAGTE